MLAKQAKGFQHAGSQRPARGEGAQIDIEFDQGLRHVGTDTGENHLRANHGGGTGGAHQMLGHAGVDDRHASNIEDGHARLGLDNRV